MNDTLPKTPTRAAKKMTHASLFSGIGGAELAALWMGWTNAFHCEINPFSRKVLEHHFPNSISYEDITTTEFTPWRGKIDILTYTRHKVGERITTNLK